VRACSAPRSHSECEPRGRLRAAGRARSDGQAAPALVEAWFDSSQGFYSVVDSPADATCQARARPPRAVTTALRGSPPSPRSAAPSRAPRPGAGACGNSPGLERGPGSPGPRRANGVAQAAVHRRPHAHQHRQLGARLAAAGAVCIDRPAALPYAGHWACALCGRAVQQV
jgi:hypothetical protein